MNDYFFSKLSIINYKMAIHEGDASRRLASQSIDILSKLFPCNVPGDYKAEFNKLISVIEEVLKNIPQEGLTPYKMGGIRNSTSAKYIKLLIEIEDSLKD